MSTTWPEVQLGEVLKRVARFEKRDDLTEYQFAGTYSFARGVFVGDRKPGGSFKLPKVQRIHKGDFVYCKIMAWEGAFGIVPEEAHNCVMSGAFVAYEVDQGQIDPRYLDYHFKIDRVWKSVGRQSTGTNVRRRSLHPEQFEATTIPLPPLDQQRRIVARVEELAALIEEARGLRAKAREEAEALLQSVLQEVFADLSQRFGLAEINSFADVKGGKRLPRGETLTNTRTPFPYIRVSDMKDHSVSLEDLKYVPEHIHSRIARYTVSAEDVYLTIAGTIGYPGLIPDELDGANLTENAAKIVFRDGISVSKKFLVYALRSPQVQEQFQRRRTISAQPKLALRRIRSSRLPLPPLPVQHSIVAYLGALQVHMYELTALHVSTQGKLDALLPSVLDRAFKGEL